MRLQPLMDAHRGLDALLAEHQEALIGLEIERARERLHAFERALHAHIDFEEAEVIPLYAKLPYVRGGGVDMFSGEHVKLRKLLAEVRGLVAELVPGAVGVRKQIVTCFDRTALFKGLLEHHDLREGQLLYPRLDEVISHEEAERLIERLPPTG